MKNDKLYAVAALAAILIYKKSNNTPGIGRLSNRVTRIELLEEGLSNRDIDTLVYRRILIEQEKGGKIYYKWSSPIARDIALNNIDLIQDRFFWAYIKEKEQKEPRREWKEEVELWREWYK